MNAKKIGIVRDKLYNYRTNLGGGVVESLKQKNCKNFMFNFMLFDKISKLIVDKKLNEESAFPFVTINIEQLLLFYNLIHSKNKPIYSAKMKEYFNCLDKNIYSDNQLEKLNKILRMKIKRIQNNNYFIFLLKNFIFRKENYMNGHKNIILNCSFYKVYQENNYKIKNILNLIRWKKRVK